MRQLMSLFMATALGMCLSLAAFSAPPSDKGGEAKKQAQPAAQVVDPSCGMQIDPAKTAGKSEYKGKTYYFCSSQCKRTFDSDPEGTLKKLSQKK